MSSQNSVSDTSVIDWEISSSPREYRCVVAHARETCAEALADLAVTDLSRTASDPRCRPEFWVGQLQFLLGYLLTAMDEEEM